MKIPAAICSIKREKVSIYDSKHGNKQIRVNKIKNSNTKTHGT